MDVVVNHETLEKAKKIRLKFDRDKDATEYVSLFKRTFTDKIEVEKVA